MKLSIVIPAHNEAATIGEVVRQVSAVTLPGIDKEIIVVDDGSLDRTGEMASAQGAVVIEHLINRGLGGALGTGIEAALRRGADLLVTFDADGQHAPADIVKVVEPILSGRVDVVIGSRLLEAGDMPAARRLANHLANLVTVILFGVRVSDSQSGLRAMTRSAAARISLVSDHYDISSEICAEIGRHRLRFTEVPIRPIYTGYSLSKGQGLRTGIKTLFRLLLSNRAR